MIELRGHHLLCAATYAGCGYDRAFEANFSAVIARIWNGESIAIVSGPDDICRRGCERPMAHCVEGRIAQRDAYALDDLTTAFGQAAQSNGIWQAGHLYGGKFKSLFKRGTIRRACFDCQWAEMCSQIAANGFRDAELFQSENGPGG